MNKTDPVYEFKRLRILNGKAYSFEHVVMPSYIAPITEEILEGSVYDYLGQEAKLQLVDAKRVIYADQADEEVSKIWRLNVIRPSSLLSKLLTTKKDMLLNFLNPTLSVTKPNLHLIFISKELKRLKVTNLKCLWLLIFICKQCPH